MKKHLIKKLVNGLMIIVAACVLSVLVCFAQIGLFAMLNGFISFQEISNILMIYTILLCFILTVYRYVTVKEEKPYE